MKFCYFISYPLVQDTVHLKPLSPPFTVVYIILPTHIRYDAKVLLFGFWLLHSKCNKKTE